MHCASPRLLGRIAPHGLLVWFVGGLATAALATAADSVIVEFRESPDLLANPGMGWQTFHRFADEDPALARLPSASAYFRFYWRELEPRDGQIDLAKIDGLLAHAHRAGQKLAFRVMCTGSGEYMDVPAWLKEQGCSGTEFTYGGGRHWVPDFADPRFLEKHLRLIRTLGQRYDGHPDLDLVDIGSVGLWGEWHMSGTKALATGQLVPLPSAELRHRLIAAWCEAFPRTSRVILIGSEEGLAGAADGGYGWRADCLGDMGGFSKTWNHMRDFYLQQLAKTKAEQVWQTAPVAFETCWDMRKWKESGWDIPFIFDYALRCHASYVNNKSAPLPEGTRAEVERLLRRLGYRLVVRKVEHAATALAGAEFSLVIDWANVGVAPPYRDDRVGMRLTNLDEPGAKALVQPGESIRGWQPGAHRTLLALPLPAQARPGRYRVAVGVLEPASTAPAVRLAIVGREPDGWYPVSEVRVRAQSDHTSQPAR